MKKQHLDVLPINYLDNGDVFRIEGESECFYYRIAAVPSLDEDCTNYVTIVKTFEVSNNGEIKKIRTFDLNEKIIFLDRKVEYIHSQEEYLLKNIKGLFICKNDKCRKIRIVTGKAPENEKNKFFQREIFFVDEKGTVQVGDAIRMTGNAIVKLVSIKIKE